MTTDHVGPLVAGRDEHQQPERIAPPRPAEELRRSFLLNLGYFWIGPLRAARCRTFRAFVAAVLLFLAAVRASATAGSRSRACARLARQRSC